MKLSLFFALLLLCGSIRAQNTPDSSGKTSAWAHAGFGLSYAKFQNSKAGILLGLGATLKAGGNLFSFRFNRNMELVLFRAPVGEIWTLEALYGRSFAFSTERLIIPVLFPLGLFYKGKFDYLFNISAGFSYVEIKERTTPIEYGYFDHAYNYTKTNRYGLPIELELMNIFSNNVAVGTGIYSNFNGGKFFVGLRGNVYVGIF